MNTSPATLREAVSLFASYENCHRFMVNVRWPDGKVRCPRCGSDDVAYLSGIRKFQCFQRHERQKFSLKAGTIFEDSTLGLEKWLPVMWMLVNARKGVTSWEIHRAVGVTPKTAWYMLQQARLAMQHGDHGTSVESVGVEAMFHPNGKITTSAMSDSGQGAPVAHRAGDGFRACTDDLQAWMDCVIDTHGVEFFRSAPKRAAGDAHVRLRAFHLFRFVDGQAGGDTDLEPMGDGDRFTRAMTRIVDQPVYCDVPIGKAASPAEGKHELFRNATACS